MNRRTFNNCIQSSDFRGLFITEMGWNSFRGQAEIQPIVINDKEYSFRTIAERNGFQILECVTDEIPVSSVYKKIDTKLRRYANDYIAIYQERGTTHHLWVVPVKSMEKRDLVSVEYVTAEGADFLFSKVDGLTFDLDEVTSIVDVKGRVQKAFVVNAEKITKDFYAGFKKEHSEFAKFISGVDDEIDIKKNKNKQWYTSVMLNRLMFCYFIQKKGFLDLDFDYLRHKLEWTQRERGENRFYNSFYKSFLSVLFHDGLNAPVHDAEFEAIYGRIPYLNGGMFDVHQIEKEYKDLDIADEAFEHLFDFFDRWRWHLDTRITASGKDINPDVLGYIFEQYINDRAQMGAYYTKEDITEYIGKNCIIPFIFDKLSTGDASDMLSSDGFVWSLLKNSGDKYVYDAMKKGYSPDWKNRIPDYIASGLDTTADNLLERRARWNEPTFSEFALPTEIWRETIDRFKRVDDVLAKINAGEIHQINDFITYNLDIRSFAFDTIEQCESPSFIRAFYHIIQNVTILDPTCGSGAFLFASLNILEPLYEICVSKMEDYNKQDTSLFAAELNEISNKYRSNVQYFIYKSIILRNLYGVDIMVEATEIAKLRLFLKMVAVVEVDKYADNLGLDPLPDVDFNIRCGNTLVGYATEEGLNNDLEHAGDFIQQIANQEFKDKLTAKMADVADTYEIFRLEQLDRDIDLATYKQAKIALVDNISELNGLLNHHLHSSTVSIPFETWAETHKPFHWLAEFYHIMHGNGGFDVVIGNPPYVEITKTLKQYRLPEYYTMHCGNLYACVFERTLSITRLDSYLGMIVQLPIVCTDRMIEAQNLLQNKTSWTYTFDDRPGKLFDDLEHIRATIFITTGEKGPQNSSRYNKWYSECRPSLFATLFSTNAIFVDSIPSIPKLGSNESKAILSKLLSQDLLARCYSSRDIHPVYTHNAPQYFTRATTYKPYFWNEKDGEKLSVSIKAYMFESENDAKIACAAINSSLFYHWFILLSDCRHLNAREIDNFPLSIKKMSLETRKELCLLCDSLMADYEHHKNRKECYYKATGQVIYDEIIPKYSKKIIDQIDRCLAKYYGLSQEELDFVINYDIKYRMGDELSAQAE